MGRKVLIFLDGVGLGEESADNPFFISKAHYLPFYGDNPILPDGTPVKPIDPLLGISGMPQSATGQTSLFTGINVPALLNKHQSSFPNKQMRKLIRNSNLLKTLKENHLKALFINAYPVYTKYFTEEYIKINPDGSFHFDAEFPRHFKRTISVTTCMLLTNNQIPFSEKDISQEHAIYQDFTNQSLIKRGLDLPEFTPEKAADILFNASGRYDFVLYEYFQTDIFGHHKDLEACSELVNRLDLFLKRLISRLDPDEDSLMVTSDHGNLEDFSTRAHTCNPVPLITWGKHSKELRARINCLVDVTPTLVQIHA